MRFLDERGFHFIEPKKVTYISPIEYDEYIPGGRFAFYFVVEGQFQKAFYLTRQEAIHVKNKLVREVENNARND